MLIPMKPQKRLVMFLFILFLTINTSYAETYTAFANIVGVDAKGKGVVGNVTVEIQPGKGRVLINTIPLQGIYTQNSERIAVQVAEKITGFDFSSYDVIYSIMTPGARVVDGPSAGAVMTLATIAAVEGKSISPAFAMTGTIQEDGSVGQVGEILAKAKAASDFGVSVFLIPKGQAIQNQYVRKVRTPAPGWYIETIEPVPVNVIEYAKENWGLKVYEVSNIREAMKYAFGEIPVQKKKPTKPLEQNVSLPTFTTSIQDYQEFLPLIEDEISRAEKAYKYAEDRLSSSELPPEIKHELTSIMQKSKQYLDEARTLKEKGYVYSAGNDAFKSLIDSKTVTDVLDYYSMSETERFTFFYDRLREVKEELLRAKEDVISRTKGGICDRDKFEWAVIARQRIMYAENKIHSIHLERTEQVGMLYDINTAEEWIYISKNFANRVKSYGNSSCLDNFKSQAEKILEEAENEVSLAKSLGLDVESAEWYLNAANKEFSEGWYITAIYDGVSAKSRAESASKYSGKNINELYEIFSREEDFTTQDLIGTIFLEYAHFMMFKAVKDDSNGEALQAIQLLLASKETDSVYSTIRKRLLTHPFSWSFNIKASVDEYLVVLVLIIVGMGIYIMSLSMRLKKLERWARMRKKKNKLDRVRKDVEALVDSELKRRLKRKEITKKEYEELRKMFTQAD